MDTSLPDLLPSSVSLKINYTNSKGISSERIVDLNTFSNQDYDPYIKAYCRTRRMARTFKIDSIKYAVDILTGQIIELDNILNYLLDDYRKDPRRAIDNFITKHKSIIDILVYVAKCDDKYHYTERIEIIKWILNTLNIEEFFDYVEPIIKKWTAPQTVAEFHYALKQSAAMNPELSELIYQKACDVVMADKKEHENEIAILKDMKNILQIEG